MSKKPLLILYSKLILKTGIIKKKIYKQAGMGTELYKYIYIKF